MDDKLAKRVSAAAGACWWTVLIGALWLTAGYFMFLAFMHWRPGWLLSLWGGGELTWVQVQTIYLMAFGLFKMALLVCVLAAIWLTLWGKRLRRIE